MIENGVHLTDSGADWFRLVQEGDIYIETFAACHVDDEGQPRYPTKTERDEWKRDFFKLAWYARRQVQGHSEVGQALAARWPELFAFILARKGAEEGGVRRLPSRVAGPRGRDLHR